eukprot:1840980-Rhodomonas_salina.1
MVNSDSQFRRTTQMQLLARIPACSSRMVGVSYPLWPQQRKYVQYLQQFVGNGEVDNRLISNGQLSVTVCR